MSATRRGAVLAAAGVAALVLSGSAFARYLPRFVVDPASNALGNAGELTLSWTQSSADSPTARATIYAPAGSSLPGDPALGAVLGTANASARVSGSTVAMTGRLTAADPTINAESPCAPGLHRQVWMLALAGGGATLSIPVFVDPVTGSLGAIRLDLCLDPPIVLGASLLRLDLHLRANTLRGPTRTGQLVWRALFTPHAAGIPDPNATVESRAIVRQPLQLTLRGKVVKRGRVVLSGGLSGGGRKLPGQSVVLLANGKVVSSTHTGSKGSYTFSLTLKRTTLYRTRVLAPARDVTKTGCGGSSTAAAGCVTATVQPFHLLSSTAVKVTVRR